MNAIILIGELLSHLNTRPMAENFIIKKLFCKSSGQKWRFVWFQEMFGSPMLQYFKSNYIHFDFVIRDIVYLSI